GGEHRAEIQLQVARVVGQRITDLFYVHQCLLGDGGPCGPPAAPHQAAFNVSSPCFQLHGHSSSVCSASSTRSTSSGLRPTFRSVTYTKRITPWGSTMKVARCATPA